MVKKKLENMTSEEIKKILMGLDNEIKILQAQIEDLRKRMVKFLANRTPDEFTKSLYPNQISLKPNSIQVISEKLNEMNKEFADAKDAYINALRQELIIEFVAENPDHRGNLTKVDIGNTESGTLARIYFK